ncbi:WD40-repeat-containing domain protein [Xylariaceae sp. FL0016]|nr:WD40-repeat-containing domain protein [Xylariaceae sp. FL0016]
MAVSTPATEVNEGARPPHDGDPSTDISLDTPEAYVVAPRSPESDPDPGTNVPHEPPAPAKKGPAKFSRKDQLGKHVKDAKDTREFQSGARSGSPVIAPSAIDPLSHHIFVRTNTDRSIASRLLNTARPESPANEGLPRPSSDLSTKLPAPQPEAAKDKKKGGSFLSRLSMIGGKKKDDDIFDDASEISEQRTEGAHAVAFSSAVGASGFIPHHKAPPRYIRVRAHNKKSKDFNHIFLAQELVGTQIPSDPEQRKTIDEGIAVHGLHKTESSTGGPIWSVEFSRDGKYLATGGRDHLVRIWAVLATHEDRRAHEEEEQATASSDEHLSAPVFRNKPVREFSGHKGDILDLSWSKNNFLLSSSMDKTVKLWHMSRRECLCTFKHKDFVTSIAFHPRDDRFFLAGSLDSVLRLWSIPDKAVAYSSQLSDIITAVSFSPEGKTAIAGCLNGLCMFYETEGLKYHTQIHVRSSRGKNAKGSKITGIQTMQFPPNAPEGIVKVLITSNDSRIRIYNLGDKSLETKLKGHENACNQIRASFSDDGSYIICGSEDRRAFIWSPNHTDTENKEKTPYEYFEAHANVVTEAIFAPTKTRQLLQSSNDPIFTLCNPPPVTLLSKEESSASQATSVYEAQSEASVKVKKPDESPAFIARSTHHDGNIIVTTDLAGVIKVFRQDCAFIKRRHENWETGSTFSKKLGREGLLGRTGSVVTRTSVGSREPHSRRGSLSQPLQGLQINSERINNWRHGVEGNHGRPLSIALSTPARSERSMSPAKPTRTPATSTAANPASEARRQPYANTPTPAHHPTSPTSSIYTTRTNEVLSTGDGSIPPTPSFSFRSFENDPDELRLDPAGASYSFWNLNRWRHLSQSQSQDSRAADGNRSSPLGHERSISASLTPDLTGLMKNRRKSAALGTEQLAKDDRIEKVTRRKSAPIDPKLTSGSDESYLAPPGRAMGDRSGSYVSRLSSELTSEGGDSDEMQCVKCGSRDFRAKKVSGKQRLLCGNCGRMTDTT